MLAPSSLHITSRYEGHYEAYLNEKLSWSYASGKCYDKGGRLAVIDNRNPDDKQEIVNSIKSYLSAYGRKWEKDVGSLWIGINQSNVRWKTIFYFQNLIILHSINYVGHDLLIFFVVGEWYPYHWHWRNANWTPTDVEVDMYSKDFEDLWGVRRKGEIYDEGCFYWMPEDVYGGSWGWISASCSLKLGFICQFKYWNWKLERCNNFFFWKTLLWYMVLWRLLS